MKEKQKIITGHLSRETGTGSLLRFGTRVGGRDCRFFPLINHVFHHMATGLTNMARPVQCPLAVTPSLFMVVLPSVSEALPLSVLPSVATLGQIITVTVTGTGFQAGARGLVWSDGVYIAGSVGICVIPSISITLPSLSKASMLWCCMNGKAWYRSKR